MGGPNPDVAPDACGIAMKDERDDGKERVRPKLDMERDEGEGFAGDGGGTLTVKFDSCARYI